MDKRDGVGSGDHCAHLLLMLTESGPVMSTFAVEVGGWNVIRFGTTGWAGAWLERNSVWYHGLGAETVVRSGIAFQTGLCEWYEAE